MQAVGTHTRSEIEAAVEEVLRDPRFQRGESLFARWWREIVEWLEGLFGAAPEGTGEFVGTLAYVGLIVAVVVAVGLLVWMMIRLRDGGDGPPVLTTPQQALAAKVLLRVEELRARAREAELRGELLTAMRLYFFALVVGLGEQGDLEYREAWTNRELFVRGKPTPDVAATLQPVLGELDEKSFGEREVLPADVAVFAGLLDRWVRERRA